MRDCQNLEVKCICFAFFVSESNKLLVLNDSADVQWKYYLENFILVLDAFEGVQEK